MLAAALGPILAATFGGFQWIAIAGVLAVVLALLSLRSWRKTWEIEDTPTSTCRGVFVGRNEVVGRAVPLAEPLLAPFTQSPTVWFQWELERWRKDDDGGEWVTVEKRSTAAPFWLQDATGRVLVRPRGADLEPVQGLQERLGSSFAPPYSRWQLRQWVLVGEDVYERQRSLADATFFEAPQQGGGFFSFTADTAGPIAGLSGRHRVTERAIPAGDDLYLLGVARPRGDAPGLEFTQDAGPLLLSTRSEVEVSTSAKRSAAWSGVGAVVLSAVFAGGLSRAITDHVRWSWPLVVVGAEVLGLFAITLVRNYNRQITVKEQAAKAWSLIDVSLRRRADLLPNLAAVAEAYAGHERQVQEAAAVLRRNPELPAQEELPTDGTLVAAEASDQRQRSATASAVALGEAYPDLRADTVFVDLQRRIADTEEAVASARTFYNDAINVLRDRRQQFPGSLFARMVAVPSWRLFEADEAAAFVPRLDLAPTLAGPPDDASGPGAPGPGGPAGPVPPGGPGGPVPPGGSVAPAGGPTGAPGGPGSPPAPGRPLPPPPDRPWTPGSETPPPPGPPWGGPPPPPPPPGPPRGGSSF